MVRLSRTIAGQSLEVRTHDEPHLDEVFALWLAERFADAAWVARFAASGLALGVEGGAFDEHARGNTNGHGRQSCTMLVAQSLTLTADQVRDLTRLVEYVHRIDTQGGGNLFDLNALVKALHAVGTQPEEVLSLVFKALDAFYAQQADFQAALVEVRKAAAYLVREPEGDRPPLIFIAVESDSRAIMPAAMYHHKERVLAVVQRRSTGHVAVLSNQGMKFPLAEVVRQIRIAELQRRGLEVRPFDGKQIRLEGTLPVVPEWFYFKPGQMMLNGSLSHPDTPPTQLPLGRIVEAVRRGLTEQLQFTEPKSVSRR